MIARERGDHEVFLYVVLLHLHTVAETGCQVKTEEPASRQHLVYTRAARDAGRRAIARSRRHQVRRVRRHVCA